MYLKIYKEEQYVKALKRLDSLGYKWASGDAMMTFANANGYAFFIADSIKKAGVAILINEPGLGIKFKNHENLLDYGEELHFLNINTVNK